MIDRSQQAFTRVAHSMSGIYDIIDVALVLGLKLKWSARMVDLDERLMAEPTFS